MQKRITIFDTVRGFTMISMAGFHACYDLAYLYGWDMPWFTQTVFQDIWRASISWVFLFIAGWMCTLSRNNAKRAAKYAAAALIVWIATTLVSVDDSVNFGIIYCMAACTAVAAVARPMLKKVPSTWGIAICLALFAATWGIPKSTYSFPYLAWLGFPGPGSFQATIIQSSRSYSCISQDTLLRVPLKDVNIPPQAGPTPIPSRRSPALDVMHSPFICCISPSFWAFWSSPTRCDNARAAVQYGPAVSPQYERRPQDIPRAKGFPAHAPA